MPKITYYTVDVFTHTRFGGNQLAVIPDATEIPERLLQNIAREFNYSETTFVYPPQNPANDCNVRIFTPGREVPMAGHPTIGTAYVLLSEGLIKPKNKGCLMIEEQVGDIRVDYAQEGSQVHSVTMNQPLPIFGPVENDYKLLAGLMSVGSDEIDLDYPIQSVSCGNNFLFVAVKSLEAIARIQIRIEILKVTQLHLSSTELFVFTKETLDASSDYHCRMFAPLFGVPEDPATGSAAGPFGSYLVKNGFSDGSTLVLEQGYEMGRPSILKVLINGDRNTITGVRVSGDVVMVSTGKMIV